MDDTEELAALRNLLQANQLQIDHHRQVDDGVSWGLRTAWRNRDELLRRIKEVEGRLATTPTEDAGS